MADMALDRLLRQVEAVADLAVDEALRHELEDFDLARRRQVLAFGRGGARRELDQARHRIPASCDRLETTGVLAIPGQNFFTLSCVHVSGIGAVKRAL
jgi:hypothetical protein